MNKIISRTVWIVSLVSLFTDISSEMLYPVMPIYLKTIGFTALWIGILEGFAEAITGLTKGYFGKWSDDIGKRLPFVQLGYSLSAISKPMMAILTFPIGIFAARSTDRLGKGMRIAARDAILSDESDKEHKGKVFGFHRAMDTLGAAIGPVFALIYLYYHPAHYKELFIIAFIPALIGVALTFLIREKRKTEPSIINHQPSNFFSYFSYWKKSSVNYKKTIVGLLAFTLFNSSDIFLLLMAKNIGVADQHIIGAYIFYNLIYALASYPMGMVADKIGMRNSFIIGLIFFSVVYSGIAFLKNTEMLYGLFFIYGLYAASTEGIAKAWVSKISSKNETATAIGFFASCSSIITLIASSTAGLIWVLFLPSVTFFISAMGTLMVIGYFFMMVKNKNYSSH